MYTVYKLQHPKTKETRYIGITNRSLVRRLSSHVYDALVTERRSTTSKWIRHLHKYNMVPVIEPVHTLDTLEHAREFERILIKQHKVLGTRLVNTAHNRSLA